MIFLLRMSLFTSNAVTVLKFGHMSSDILAYGASDGSLTVCSLSEEPSLLKQLTGHSKDVTGSIDWYCFLFIFLYLGRSACYPEMLLENLKI